MLTELRVVNFALIEQLSLQFKGGFTVLTGETGAGKSILIDAITLLVGGRASTDHIRSGAEEAQVEAAFSLAKGGPLLARLRHEGILGPHESDLIIRRAVARSGRNRIYVNGNLTPLHTIETFGGTLVDIHGQHDQQSLLSTGRQLASLDAYGRLIELGEDYRRAYRLMLECSAELDGERSRIAEAREREELLRYQCEEIERAELRQDEEGELLAERGRLTHAQRLQHLAEELYTLLYAGDGSALSQLGRADRQLQELCALDPEAAEWKHLCDEASVQLKELATQMRGYRERTEPDPERLATVENRLDLLQRLTKKYGGDLNAVIEQGHRLRRQLDAIASADHRIEALEVRLQQARTSAEALADKLSARRTAAGQRLTKELRTELATLRMDHAKFEVRLDRGALDPRGRDRVEFLFSANEGEPLQPLARVASGGELSRVMLAVKTVLAGADEVPVLIFDEVDAGTGGAAAETVGSRLKRLGRYHQVLCVTHLPQVASQGDHHFRVDKQVRKDRTVTSVTLLNGESRREEIARMLGGATITQKVRATAAEMIGTNDKR
jgi:DNA repair protein RecN (Recombination protein N)